MIERQPYNITPQTELDRCSAYAIERLAGNQIWAWRCRYKGKYVNIAEPMLIFCGKHINLAFENAEQ